jgi:hypothetical protein
MYAYPAENQVLNNIRKLLTEQQERLLLRGAHYLFSDDGALFYSWKHLTAQNHQIIAENDFIIEGMGEGDIQIQYIRINTNGAKNKFATLLCIKPHLPPKPHFIKAWIMKILENFFGISFGPRGFCRYNKNRPITIDLSPEEIQIALSIPVIQTYSSIHSKSYLPTFNAQHPSEEKKSDLSILEQPKRHYDRLKPNLF